MKYMKEQQMPWPALSFGGKVADELREKHE